MSKRVLMSLVFFIVPVTLFAAPKTINRARERVQGEYLVMLQKDISDLATVGTRLAREHGGKAVHFYPDIKTMLVQMTDAQAQSLLQDPRVLSVEENAIMHIASMTSPQMGFGPWVPSSPAMAWGLDRLDQLPGGNRLDNTYTWGPDGTGAQIYVMDTGVLPYHPEFGWPHFGRVRQRALLSESLADMTGANYLKAEQCWNEGDSSNQPDFSAVAAHGTAVAAIAAGDTFGVAKGATIVDARVARCDGSFTAARLAAAIDWVCRIDGEKIPGRVVINLSLSGPNDADLMTLHAQIATAVYQYNIPVVTAAGNHNLPASGFMPGSAPAAINVGGSSKNADTRWTATVVDPTRGTSQIVAGSNFGDTVRVYAPAEFVESASTCIAPPPPHGSDPIEYPPCPWPAANRYYRSALPDCGNYPGNVIGACTSGTSFAAPHVSGWIARRLSFWGGMTSAQLVNEINAHALVWVTEPDDRQVPLLHYWAR